MADAQRYLSLPEKATSIQPSVSWAGLICAAAILAVAVVVAAKVWADTYAAAISGRNRYAITGTANRAYLVDQETGQAWYLHGVNKTAVRFDDPVEATQSYYGSR